MRTAPLAFSLLLATAACPQSGEFTVHPNGYIYSEAAMGQLHRIVDSLNIRFRACPADRVYRSLPHASTRALSLSGERVKAVVRDMEAGMAWEEIVKRHPGIKVGPERPCAFLHYQSDGDPVTAVVPISFSSSMRESIDVEGKVELQKGKWLMERSSYDKKEYLEAMVITGDPVWPALPERYGRLVQYVDCLIDTTQRIYSPNAGWDGRGRSSGGPPAVEQFLRMADKAVTVKYPEWSDALGADAYARARAHYETERLRQLDSLAADPSFGEALDEAVQAALTQHKGGEQLEELVERYGRKADALALKRERRVMGMCSMDDSPRRHALDIATLAAETVNWDIFLRSHLDILNDRFSRASDGSYAWAARQTYVHELEDLEIAVPDLLLGTLLHADNVSEGHYTASANRTGRAITEAKDAEAIAERMLAMIADPELDLYNRAIIYYAFLNYNGHLEDTAVQQRNEQALDAAMAGLPKEVVGKRR